MTMSKNNSAFSVCHFTRALLLGSTMMNSSTASVLTGVLAAATSTTTTTVGAVSLDAGYSVRVKHAVDRLVAQHGAESDSVVSVGSNSNERKLQGFTEEEFETLCVLITNGLQQELEGATCDCEASDFSIRCEQPQQCDLVVEGCEGDVCMTGTSVMKFDDSPLVSEPTLTSLQVIVSSSGPHVTYESQRFVLLEDGCEAYATPHISASQQEEIQCRACSVCDEEQSINVDCSNIQPDATSEGCVDVDRNPDQFNQLFDICYQDDGDKNKSGTAVTATGHHGVFLALTAMIALALV